MFQVFNMGHRMEIYLPEKHAKSVVQIAESFGVEARVIGHVEVAERPAVNIHHEGEVLTYSKEQ